MNIIIIGNDIKRIVKISKNLEQGSKIKVIYGFPFFVYDGTTTGAFRNFAPLPRKYLLAG